MKFYLIDKNKVRTMFESELVHREIKLTDWYTFSISVHDVNYEIDPDSLDVRSAEPLNEKAIALSTDGLVRWKNQYRKYEEDKHNNIAYRGTIYDYDHILVHDAFCSGFICLGKTPLENALKITAKNLKVFDSKDKAVYSLDKVGIKVTEAGDFLMLEKNNLDIETIYRIGPVINNKLYIILEITQYVKSIKVEIPRGTCFKTYFVVKDITSEKLNDEAERPPHELCY